MGILFKKYLWVVYLFLIFLGSFFLAKMASTLIASKLRIEKNLEVAKMNLASGPAKTRAGFDDYKVIIDRNIFDSREMAPLAISTPAPSELDLNAPAVKTSLAIKLVSTFSVGAGTDKRSTATITGGQGAAAAGDIYTVEDEKQFAPGVKITKILPDRIEFINGPRLEYADIEKFGATLNTGKPVSALDKPAAGTPPAGDSVQQTEQGKFVVDRAELEAALANLDQLFTQIRAVPQFQGGKSSGLKLLSIKGGSIFAKLGLKRNDILERINGQEMDMKRGMEIFGQLKESNRISIDLVRDGKKTTLEYDIQ